MHRATNTRVLPDGVSLFPVDHPLPLLLCTVFISLPPSSSSTSSSSSCEVSPLMPSTRFPPLLLLLSLPFPSGSAGLTSRGQLFIAPIVIKLLIPRVECVLYIRTYSGRVAVSEVWRICVPLWRHATEKSVASAFPHCACVWALNALAVLAVGSTPLMKIDSQLKWSGNFKKNVYINRALKLTINTWAEWKVRYFLD